MGHPLPAQRACLYELYFDAEGAHEGINNAFMFFSRSSSLLDDYLQRCYEVLEQGRESKSVERTAMGPALLQQSSIDQNNVIRGLNILNFKAISKMYNDPEVQIPSHIQNRLHDPIGAVNLCLNERSFFGAEQQPIYDAMVERAVQRLLTKE